MKNMLKTFLKVEAKNIKFKAAFIILLFTIVGCIFYLDRASFNDLEESTAGEVIAMSSALDQFRKVDATDTEQSSPIYRNLIQQTSHLGTRTLGMKFNDSDTIIEGSLALAKERQNIYQLRGFKEIEEYIPSTRKNQLDLVKYQTLEKENRSVYIKNNNLPSYIFLVITTFGYFWYLYCGILSSDILINDDRHSSIVNNYPYSIGQKLLSKTVNYILLLVSFLTGGIILSMILGLIKYNADFSYPIAILGTKYQTVDVMTFILISWGYLVILTITAVLVSILLNYFIKNIYIIIFIHMGFFFLGGLSSIFSRFTWMLPYHYLNYTNVFNGVIAETTNHIQANILFGGLSLMITCIFLVVFIYIRFHLSSTNIRKKEV